VSLGLQLCNQFIVSHAQECIKAVHSNLVCNQRGGMTWGATHSIDKDSSTSHLAKLSQRGIFGLTVSHEGPEKLSVRFYTHPRLSSTIAG
jgi:hypothetical protein